MEREKLDDSDLIAKIKKDTKNFNNILWDILTPFERGRVLKRIKKQTPEIQYETNSVTDVKKLAEKTPTETVALTPEITDDKSIEDEVPKPKDFEGGEEKNKFNVWDLKTKYRVAFADMIEQRTTMMKFLLDNYGIETVEKFFLSDNPEWAEKLKVGKMKKIFAKMISKLAPSLLMRRLTGIIVSQAQYLVGIDYITVTELTDNCEILEISNCPVLKQFKKTIKALKFSNLERRYVCSFACVPVLAQMCAVGNCNLKADYTDKGCYLIITLKPKESAESKQSQPTTLIKNGPL
ncbi:MAG: hypothetical protein HWN66_00165 [Candidatus Helarchaeota archaeon]|nr:hypothetical protein [Candidatus Helarchaeota archaeon]